MRHERQVELLKRVAGAGPTWNYFVKNLDLLLEVTGGEDFPVMERIQRNLESGALPEVVFGRNEAPLIHLHQSINDAPAAAGCRTTT